MTKDDAASDKAHEELIAMTNLLTAFPLNSQDINLPLFFAHAETILILRNFISLARRGEDSQPAKLSSLYRTLLRGEGSG